jgi:hypothetical protein
VKADSARKYHFLLRTLVFYLLADSCCSLQTFLQILAVQHYSQLVQRYEHQCHHEFVIVCFIWRVTMFTPASKRLVLQIVSLVSLILASAQKCYTACHSYTWVVWCQGLSQLWSALSWAGSFLTSHDAHVLVAGAGTDVGLWCQYWFQPWHWS